MNTIRWSLKASKQLRKIDRTEANRIYAKAQLLATFPGYESTDIKALKNHACQYRLRVGNYRLLFNFDGVIHVISIEEVRKRDENTY